MGGGDHMMAVMQPPQSTELLPLYTHGGGGSAPLAFSACVCVPACVRLRVCVPACVCVPTCVCTHM